MNKNLKNNIVIFFLYLGLWLIVDLIDVKLFKKPGHKYDLLMILGVVFLSFAFINRKLFLKLNPFLRWFSLFILSAGLTSLWFFLTVSVLIEFHVSIGGHI